MENIQQGFNQFRERIKPAVLVDSPQNANILGAYCVMKGHDIRSLDAEQVADALYEACNSEVGKLQWQVKPKKLQILDDKGIRNTALARADQNEFAEKTKKAEAAKEYQKKQDATKKQLDQMIENVQFVDGLRGRIAHGKTDAVKQTLRSHVEKAVKGNRDLTVVVKEVQSYIEKQYEEAEKALERV